VRRFVGGVTAAATGALAGAALLLAARVIVDVRAVAIASVVFVLLLARVKVPEPVLIVGAGTLGLVLSR
ncbi:MAG: chromate transporter, partial [Gemmatimonadaceae bacterium]